jgi:integrase
MLKPASTLRQFAAWFERRIGEPFALDAVAEYDVRGWRDHLEETRKPATVNRKLSALRALFRWAGEALQLDPEAVGGKDVPQKGPRPSRALLVGGQQRRGGGPPAWRATVSRLRRGCPFWPFNWPALMRRLRLA